MPHEAPQAVKTKGESESEDENESLVRGFIRVSSV